MVAPLFYAIKLNWPEVFLELLTCTFAEIPHSIQSMGEGEVEDSLNLFFSRFLDQALLFHLLG